MSKVNKIINIISILIFIITLILVVFSWFKFKQDTYGFSDDISVTLRLWFNLAIPLGLLSIILLINNLAFKGIFDFTNLIYTGSIISIIGITFLIYIAIYDFYIPDYWRYETLFYGPYHFIGILLTILGFFIMSINLAGAEVTVSRSRKEVVGEDWITSPTNNVQIPKNEERPSEADSKQGLTKGP